MLWRRGVSCYESTYQESGFICICGDRCLRLSKCLRLRLEIEVSLVTRDGRELGRRNSTQEGPKSEKKLVSMKNWKAALDREHAKRDRRSIKKSGQGPMSVAWLGGMFLEAIGGLQGGEWHDQIYSLKQSHWLLSGIFIKSYYVPSTESAARGTTVRLVPPRWTTQPTGKIKH